LHVAKMFATLPGDADDPTFSKDFYVFGNGLPAHIKAIGNAIWC